jgi:rRNA maturation RNase YbeY
VINFFNENIERPSIDYKIVKQWIKYVINYHEFKTKDISIVFCSDDYLLDINRKYLDHDYFTDIITFNYNNKLQISGDLFISIETVKKNAADYNVTENDELLRVIIHGILHLLGFNDQTEIEISLMREQETIALELYNSL